MKRYDLLIVGAGPAGLSAAIEAAGRGMRVAVIDENDRPGGQLFKQIHKFFGSKEHRARIRGMQIGRELLEQARQMGVEVMLGQTVNGLFFPLKVSVHRGDHITGYTADNILLATGASENTLPFEGWTLPGVMGAGAAQTMMNLHGVRPGERVLMVGSGNVGLVVAFQLLQAGCRVEAVVDAAPRIGGYGVHAAKLARTGVPIYTRHTVLCALGEERVTGAVIAQVDEKFQPIPGTQRQLEVDTVCMAVGLSPMAQLARMAGCEMEDKGGLAPRCDQYGQTSLEGLFAAGDVAGIEEASSAMITGRIAALAAAHRSGFLADEEFLDQYQAQRQALDQLHKGLFAPGNKGRTDLTLTDEGLPLSQSLLERGYMADEELSLYPGAAVPYPGVHPVIECSQNIPCNPCQDACPYGCIQVGQDITGLPRLSRDEKCRGCGLCVAACSGQAIFLVDETYEPGYASVTLPYEFLPLPQPGQVGQGLDRSGQPVCRAQVIRVQSSPAFDRTHLLSIKVPVDMAGRARFFRAGEQEGQQ